MELTITSLKAKQPSLKHHLTLASINCMPNKTPPKNAPIKKDKQAKGKPAVGILIAAMPAKPKKGKKA